MDLASDSDSGPFEALLPREPHGVALGIAALLAKPTVTPTPFPATQAGCHRWRYALRWERPSRLAILKNVLGKSVTTYTEYKAPGAGTQDDWPDPIRFSGFPGGDNLLGSGIKGAWDFKSPSQTTTTLFGGSASYNHDCGSGGNPCKAADPSNPSDEGEQPEGIFYSTGSWDYPDPAITPRRSSVDPFGVPNAPVPYPEPVYHPRLVGPDGLVDGWAWTLNYGYTDDAKTIFGPDPGPPLPVMVETSRFAPDSTPGETGVPLPFPSAFATRGSGRGGPGAVLAQPTWTTNAPSDVVGKTSDKVNWGLMTFADASGLEGAGAACGDVPKNYHLLVKIDKNSLDTGDVKAIEDFLRLRMDGGLEANGGTPTKGAIEQADAALTTTWNDDPKKACDRAYGVILCTDGESNTCNKGVPPDTEWDVTATPCKGDTDGTAFANFPPGAAETMYLDAHQRVPGSADAIIRARTFAIGISTDISRCELNRIAYRGRTDASAPRKDAGFVLFDPAAVPPSPGDQRLPHIDTATNNDSGPSRPAPAGFNRFGPDQSSPDNSDYAFFANDAKSLLNAFLAIVRASAAGDFTTSAPVAGGSIGHGNTVILPSTRYPGWEGHIRAIDTTDPLKSVVLWDAGDVLTNAPQPWQPTPATRRLYTWDPADGHLIPIDKANAGAIDSLCGTCGVTVTAADGTVTSPVVDFIRGNDGTLKDLKRKWLLGPPINATPAISGPPQPYLQSGNVVPHQPFESAYAKRRPLAWVGADDGFLHAFDFEDGAEVLGLLPPNLIARQVDLYNNFLAGESTTGQNGEIDQHTWGVANSLRFADVWFPLSGDYKTVGFLTEGPGGTVVAAIDITHPFPGRASDPAVGADKFYGTFTGGSGLNAGKPVDILWTKESKDYAGLFGSWSVPAVAPNAFLTSRMTFGAGINPKSNLNDGPKDANIFVVDPTSGALTVTLPVPIAPLTGLAAPLPLVGHQTFADSVFIQTNAASFHPDNVANLSLQADTNGRINALWGDWTNPSSKVLIDLNAAAGGIPQPIYYSPAANGIGTLGCQVYAIGSGSLYEKSPAVSGWNVNRIGSPPAGSGFDDNLPVFVPSLFIATNPFKITDTANFATTPLGTGAMSSFVQQMVIGGETAGIPLQPTDPTFTSTHTRLGIHSQITSSPLMVLNFATGQHDVLFSVYDPDWGCHGFSYIIVVEFTIGGGCGEPKIGVTTVYAAGEGASSGFATTDQGIKASHSGMGSADAGLGDSHVDRKAVVGSPSFEPLWWKEQK